MSTIPEHDPSKVEDASRLEAIKELAEFITFHSGNSEGENDVANDTCHRAFLGAYDVVMSHFPEEGEAGNVRGVRSEVRSILGDAPISITYDGLHPDVGVKQALSKILVKRDEKRPTIERGEHLMIAPNFLMRLCDALSSVDDDLLVVLPELHQDFLYAAINVAATMGMWEKISVAYMPEWDEDKHRAFAASMGIEAAKAEVDYLFFESDSDPKNILSRETAFNAFITSMFRQEGVPYKIPEFTRHALEDAVTRPEELRMAYSQLRERIDQKATERNIISLPKRPHTDTVNAAGKVATITDFPRKPW